jgi:hypothetical protein
LAKNGSFGFLSVGLSVGKNQMCHLWVGFFTLSDNVLLLQDACGLDSRVFLAERIYDDST